MAKIYTKTGDDGTTGLIGGARLPKSDPRIDAYGTVDELNAAIGLAATVADASMLARLRQVQNELFVVGSNLAVADEAKDQALQGLPALGDEQILRLETEIDAAEAQMQPLRQFILPGGIELAARLHLARTVCRRAERLVVAVGEAHALSPSIVRYLNRLSDWLFVQARLANHVAGVPDVPWQK
jgi:cob(I)alamin adenosyltransferase